MTKSLSNKLFLKKQLYSPQMKEGTLILQLNAFNQILSDLLALEVKLEEEDKTLLLLSSLLQSYDHLATTIMHRKETLELEDVRQMDLFCCYLIFFKVRNTVGTKGYAWPVSLKYILACGCLSLIIDPVHQEFFSRGLVPKENYWPMLAWPTHANL